MRLRTPGRRSENLKGYEVVLVVGTGPSELTAVGDSLQLSWNHFLGLLVKLSLATRRLLRQVVATTLEQPSTGRHRGCRVAALPVTVWDTADPRCSLEENYDKALRLERSKEK